MRSESRQFDYDPRKYAGPEERGPRWRNKERGPRLPGDMGPEVRRVMVRRNGVRFQDSDWATEESQSTSSSSGGGGTARDYLDEPRTPAREVYSLVASLSEEDRIGNLFQQRLCGRKQ
ncbi:hypothetical protein CDAR_395841 [Caerostris darwini]|uniref:Uncharacterized protein n=1 Tax=Caerostris darwini TaxID=1538125 RepID=A0AAV4QJP8_9ARAC|nr:hypothetical protein CDAR_395841 [Caerostris darwini]